MREQIAVSKFMTPFGNNKLTNCLAKIKYRCSNPNCPQFKNYGGRGVGCFITLKELQSLWVRDNASKMKTPSIDRIDNNGHYIFENCRFIELSENSKKMHREKYQDRMVDNYHIPNYQI